MKAVREALDKYKPIFRMGVTDLYDGTTHRLEDFVAGLFDLRISEEAMYKAVALREPENGKTTSKDREAAESAYKNFISMIGRGISNTPGGRRLHTLFQRNVKRLKLKRLKYGKGRPLRPDADEGHIVANALLADPFAQTMYDPESGLEPVVELLADTWLSQLGGCDLVTLLGFIEDSEKIAFFWDLLECICKKKLSIKGTPTPHELVDWQIDVNLGLRHRPPEKNAPNHRPRDLGFLVRDIKVWFALKTLDDIGALPTSTTDNSGFAIVGKRLHMSRSAVREIWYGPPPWQMVEEFVIDTVERIEP